MSVDITKCKCWIYPFEPPSGCFDFCAGFAVGLARPQEMVKYFKLRLALAEKIFEISSNSRLQFLSEYKPRLDEEEYLELVSRLRNLSSSSSLWIRRKVRESMVVPA